MTMTILIFILYLYINIITSYQLKSIQNNILIKNLKNKISNKINNNNRIIRRSPTLYDTTADKTYKNLDISSKTELILNTLRNIVDIDSGLDIVTANIVNNLIIQSDNSISFNLEVKDLTSVVNDEMKKYCIIELSLIDWINNIQISIVPKKQVSVAKNLNSLTEVKSPLGLEKVKNIIAVSSCKGGVGKSTVAVNLAYTLAQAGARVGILDADIYGPSLPTMTKPSSTDVIFEGNMIKPLEFRGVKLMSMGYISKGAAIMRGPMVNQILNQFVSLCNWGELDYLLLDMPPGTGDIQLTLAQIMNITAAVIVTTPQRLSFVDVVKGIDLFDTVNVPCVAVVENMAEYSTYQFDDNFYDQLTNEINTLITNQKSTNDLKDLLIRSIGSQKKPLRVFGLGHSSKLRDMWGIENQVAIPLLDEVSLCGDIGTPYVLQYPDSPLAQAMIDLAGGVISEIEAISLTNKYSTPSLNYLAESNEIKLVDGSNTASIKPFTLRDECRCAVCVEEFTGKKLLDEKKIPIDIKPLGFSPIGRYAISVDWSDNHKSLYPFRQIRLLAGLTVRNKNPISVTN